MKPTLCSRCKKNLAVIFITKIDGGKTVNEGLCLKCAKEMGIKLEDYIKPNEGIYDDNWLSAIDTAEVSEAASAAY